MTLNKYIKTLIQDKSNRFVLQMVLVYISWKMLYVYLSDSTGRLHQTWVDIVYYLSLVYTKASVVFLKNIGEQTVAMGNIIFFPVTNVRISVEEHCLAIPAMYIFTCSILIFSGNWKNKLWFIPAGVLGVALINISRMVLLAFIYAHFPTKYFMFHHSFSFVVITYSLILVMVFIWMNYFSGLQMSKQTNQSNE